ALACAHERGDVLHRVAGGGHEAHRLRELEAVGLPICPESPPEMAQKSCTRARGKRATLSVWSGWWWLMTTSVTEAGSTPRPARGSRIRRRSATIPGSTMTVTSPSRLTVLATRSLTYPRTRTSSWAVTRGDKAAGRI